jgi:hypothetical protein
VEFCDRGLRINRVPGLSRNARDRPATTKPFSVWPEGLWAGTLPVHCEANSNAMSQFLDG